MGMSNNGVNKIVWIYWHDGWENAPEIALKCLESWKVKNPDWEIKELCKSNLPDYIDLNAELPGIESKKITLTSLSDIIRILLLDKFGGIWVDSTVLCRMPLNEWSVVFSKEDFFAFSKPANDRLVSSWFLTAKKDSYIVKKWKEKTIEFWKNRRSVEEYFWFHYLFNELYTSDIEFKNSWDSTPKIAAFAPHYFTPYSEKFFESITDEKKRMISRVQSPVFKLTYKYDTAKEKKNTVLEYILKSDNPVIKPKILIAWYGSFFQNGTVGDYLAVNSLTNFLEQRNYEFDCVSYKHFEGLKGREITLQEILPEQYDVIIFCCGPMLKHHPHLSALFDRFKHAYKIGISVSLFPPEHFNYYNPFDCVIARENSDINYEDIAILANPIIEIKKQMSTKITVGLVLRNEQGEYGIENCKHIEANGYIKRLAEQLIERNEGGHIIEIENHLERSKLTPSEIEGLYSTCDFILTTRFHGSMMALRNNVPFIAIDQIENGAKVYGLVSQTSYPFVWKVNEVSYEEIMKVAEELLNGIHNYKLIKAKSVAESRAKMSLEQLDAHLHSFVMSGR